MRRFLVILSIFISSFGWAQTTPVSQSEVQAVFLFHFTSFVDWPNTAFADINSPLVIGVLGNNPFGKHLENAITGEKKGTHPITVKYYSSVEEIKGCHILYIVKPAPEDLTQIMVALKGRNILTVGDVPYFTNHGGMIKFFTDNNKVRLQINLEAAKNANLVISSKLLKVAEILNQPQP